MLPTPRRKDPRPAPHIMLSDHAAACDFLSDFLAIFETSLIFWYVTWRLGVFSFDGRHNQFRHPPRGDLVA
jgi:hypothetical protein